MDIFLVRHGEAAQSWGEATDPGLSELGNQQALATARALHSRVGEGIQLLSSPLARAQETAAPLGELLQLPVAVNEAFRELPSPVPQEQRQVWLRNFMQQEWPPQPQNLQTWRQLAVRQLLELRGPAVVFTHFMVINAVVGHILEMEKTVHFWPDNASITQLRLQGNTLQLVSLGQQIKTVVN